MANIKSVAKRARQSIKHHDRNATVVSALKTARKKVHQAIAGGDAANVQATFQNLISQLDKAAKRGIIHSNAANRGKSRFLKLVTAKPEVATASA